MKWKHTIRRIARLNRFGTLAGAVIAESCILAVLSAAFILIGFCVCDVGPTEIFILAVASSVLIATRAFVRVYGDRMVDALKRRMWKKDKD